MDEDSKRHAFLYHYTPLALYLAPCTVHIYTLVFLYARWYLVRSKMMMLLRKL